MHRNPSFKLLQLARCYIITHYKTASLKHDFLLMLHTSINVKSTPAITKCATKFVVLFVATSILVNVGFLVDYKGSSYKKLIRAIPNKLGDVIDYYFLKSA